MCSREDDDDEREEEKRLIFLYAYGSRLTTIYARLYDAWVSECMWVCVSCYSRVKQLSLVRLFKQLLLNASSHRSSSSSFCFLGFCTNTSFVCRACPVTRSREEPLRDSDCHQDDDDDHNSVIWLFLLLFLSCDKPSGTEAARRTDWRTHHIIGTNETPLLLGPFSGMLLEMVSLFTFALIVLEQRAAMEIKGIKKQYFALIRRRRRRRRRRRKQTTCVFVIVEIILYVAMPE